MFLMASKLLPGVLGAGREICEAIEGKATVYDEHTGAEGGAVKLSLEETLDRIWEAYGLRRRPKAEDASSLSVSKQVDRGPLPLRDSD